MTRLFIEQPWLHRVCLICHTKHCNFKLEYVCINNKRKTIINTLHKKGNIKLSNKTKHERGYMALLKLQNTIKQPIS